MLIEKLKNWISNIIIQHNYDDIIKMEDEMSILEDRIDYLRGALYDIANASSWDQEDVCSWADQALLHDDQRLSAMLREAKHDR